MPQSLVCRTLAVLIAHLNTEYLVTFYRLSILPCFPFLFLLLSVVVHDSCLSKPLRFARKKMLLLQIENYLVKLLVSSLNYLCIFVLISWCLLYLCRISSTLRFRTTFPFFERNKYYSHHTESFSLPPDSQFRSCFSLRTILLDVCTTHCYESAFPVLLKWQTFVLTSLVLFFRKVRERTSDWIGSYVRK